MTTEGKAKRADWKKHLIAVLLIFAAWAIASLGRLALDWGIQEWPTHEAIVERVGGWLLGLIGVGVVVLPMLRLYGLISRPRCRDDTR